MVTLNASKDCRYMLEFFFLILSFSFLNNNLIIQFLGPGISKTLVIIRQNRAEYKHYLFSSMFLYLYAAYVSMAAMDNDKVHFSAWVVSPFIFTSDKIKIC